MNCPFCPAVRPRELMAQHLSARHDWKPAGSVFAELVYRDGFYWCATCGDPCENDDAFVAIIEGRTPEPCDYCGRSLVRMQNDTAIGDPDGLPCRVCRTYDHKRNLRVYTDRSGRVSGVHSSCQSDHNRAMRERRRRAK